MRSKVIRWVKRTRFEGPNGLMQCCGIEIEGGQIPYPANGQTEHGLIRLAPITSKGQTGRGFIEVPADREILKELERALWQAQAELEVSKEESDEIPRNEDQR